MLKMKYKDYQRMRKCEGYWRIGGYIFMTDKDGKHPHYKRWSYNVPDARKYCNNQANEKIKQQLTKYVRQGEDGQLEAALPQNSQYKKSVEYKWSII